MTARDLYACQTVRGHWSRAAVGLSFWIGLHFGTITHMASFNLRVNGQSYQVNADPGTPLLYILSDDLALRGPKFGCGLGQCGSCTVLVNGQAVRSCVTPVESITAQSEITTLESLGTIE